MAFPVVELDGWSVLSEESGGAHPKLWLVKQPGDDASQSWLWKPAGWRRAEEGGNLRPWITDHYSERIVCELAGLFGLPAAPVQLGRRNGVEGSMSQSIIPKGWSRVAGDVLLSSLPGYLSLSAQASMRTGQIIRDGYTLANIASVLDSANGPPGTEWEPCSAFDVFVGYLILDAWVANSDRHAENWLVLSGEDGAQRLGASFDHGTALGSGFKEPAYIKHVDRMESWCRGGKARTFEGRPSLLHLAREATEMGGPRARQWLAALANVERGQWQQILSQIEGMSDLAVTFCDRLLTINQERLTK